MELKDYCVYDTETTGLSSQKDSVLELAAKRYKGGKVESKKWLIRSPGFNAVPPIIVEITGITSKEIEEHGMDERQAWTEFVEFVGNLPLVGHNIMKFDNHFLTKYLDKYNLPTPDGIWVCIDTAAIFKAKEMKATQRPADSTQPESEQHFYQRILNTPMRGLKFNLVFACDKEGIDVSDLDAHRADADVEMTDRLFKKLYLGITDSCVNIEKEIQRLSGTGTTDCDCPHYRAPEEGCDCYCHEHPKTVLKWYLNAIANEKA